MSGRNGILAAGNWIVDQVKMIDDYPEQDALTFITTQASSNGGGPYNVLKDLAALGAEFPLMAAGLVGGDAQGQWILDDCQACGIDTSGLRRTDVAPTSYTDVMTVAGTGRRTFFHQAGTNALLDVDDIDLASGNGRIFYLGYLLLLEKLDRVDSVSGRTGASIVLERAGDAGMTTVVDLVSTQGGKFSEVVTPALPFMDILFLNEYEAGNLLGRDVTGDLMGAGCEILAKGVRGCVVIHTPDFGVAVSADGERLVQGSVKVSQTEIKGAVGAGDAFAAGFLLGYHEDKALDVCLRYAVCAAASCLRDPSTSGGVRPLAEVLGIGELWGYRDKNELPKAGH